MRYCMAPRWLGPGEKGGGLTAAAAKILQLQIAQAAEAAATLAQLEAQQAAAEAQAAGLAGGDGGGGDDDVGGKRKKRVSLYADQGGGIANPQQNRYKKGRRPGDPAGPGHVRAKW